MHVEVPHHPMKKGDDETESTPHLSNRSKDIYCQEQQICSSTHPSSIGGETILKQPLERID